MDNWHYLLVLAACLVITAPLEIFGDGVYRQARRAATAILPAAAVFVLWDVIAIFADVWTYNSKYVTGIDIPGVMPIEELLFFIVIPLCGLLTYNAVTTILTWLQRTRGRVEQTK
ncbi:lycopene cyclase [Mycolicibacterium acapulense]|uniref:Lycopene cyclase n=1 Tax=Mycobacterium lehmannii TaxID=2048550 RepID=A0A117JIP6_9MYCO|nr:lycopene cyclase domain-containing protein [Mycobacterium lehmannii]KUH98359.1 lycopene cyclase [Mycolicibacterium acapulense]KUH98864.1 lycopene cyclase [Mycolicibacterium acapulense]KUI12390.1 lycopene cyclase [Mycobacterium lehmannii]KUI18104.1 lycopene cyclase [Mycolicibacterium acapulense]